MYMFLNSEVHSSESGCTFSFSILKGLCMLSIYQVDTIIDEYGNLVCSFRIEIDFLLICAPYTLYHSTSVEESQCSGPDTKIRAFDIRCFFL